MPRIRFDRQTCSGFFSCTKVAPNLFQRADDDRSDLVGSQEEPADIWVRAVDADGLDAAKEAAIVCPVDAIQVIDDDGTVLAGPARLRTDP